MVQRPRRRHSSFRRGPGRASHEHLRAHDAAGDSRSGVGPLHVRRRRRESSDRRPAPVEGRPFKGARMAPTGTRPCESRKVARADTAPSRAASSSPPRSGRTDALQPNRSAKPHTAKNYIKVRIAAFELECPRRSVRALRASSAALCGPQPRAGGLDDYRSRRARCCGCPTSAMHTVGTHLPPRHCMLRRSGAVPPCLPRVRELRPHAFPPARSAPPRMRQASALAAHGTSAAPGPCAGLCGGGLANDCGAEAAPRSAS